MPTDKRRESRLRFVDALDGAEETALAGSELLAHFQQGWTAIHDTALRNRCDSNVLSAKMTQLQQKCACDSAAVEAVPEEMKAVQVLAVRINNMNKFADNLMDEFEKIVRVVHECEMAKSASNLVKEKNQQQRRLEQYRSAKLQYLDSVKEELSGQLLTRACQNQRQRLERHNTFEQMSHEEIDLFRRHRQIGSRVRASSMPRNEQVSCLEDVDIATEIDTQELDQFLSDN